MRLSSVTSAIVNTVVVVVSVIRATDTVEMSSTVQPLQAASSAFTPKSVIITRHHTINKTSDTDEDDAVEDGMEEDQRGDQTRHEEGENAENSVDSQDNEHHDKQDTHRDTHWRYYGLNGPENWWLLHKQCGSNSPLQQSPIDIETQKTKLNELLMEISPIVDRVDEDAVTIANTGHTVNFAYNRTTIRLADGGYDHTYRVIGVHFHWGRDSLTGSEHRTDGKTFPLEMHVVSYDEDNYNDVLEAAAANGDGIAVLSVLFQISEQNNSHFSPVVSNLKDVQKPGSSVRIEYFDLTALLPSNLKDFYRYKGSLTTPPCSESVVWTVFATTQSISEAQLSEFRSLNENTPETSDTKDVRRLLFNWRPIQPVGKRTVYRSFPLPGLDFAMKTPSSQDSDYDKWMDDSYEHSSSESVNVIWTGHHCQLLILISVFNFMFLSIVF